MTIKNKFLIIASLFVSIILLANFALAENDDESETEDIYVPAVNQTIPVAPVINTTPTAPITTQTETIQPVSTVTIQEIPVNVLTDSDADGIIDSMDKYPGQDDFSFNVLDANKNGVIDELEYLLNL